MSTLEIGQWNLVGGWAISEVLCQRKPSNDAGGGPSTVLLMGKSSFGKVVSVGVVMHMQCFFF